MISSRLGKIVDSSKVVRSCSLSKGLEKITWRTLSIRTWACSVANSSEWTENRKCCKTLGCQCSPQNLCWVDLSFVPLITSCRFVSFLLRIDRASGKACSLQLGGSCSNSRKRGSISSSCGEGLVGEWLRPSGAKTGPSKLKSIEWGKNSFRWIISDKITTKWLRGNYNCELHYSWFWTPICSERVLTEGLLIILWSSHFYSWYYFRSVWWETWIDALFICKTDCICISTAQGCDHLSHSKYNLGTYFPLPQH